ncbi:MAG: large-conductance mechanosensitive channel protein MscL [Burkholderiales bacterium]|nr:large-conductance mechanosensitive channel protein MscL [Burkholderiales bacterium]
MGMLKEFREFAVKGNVVDLAVAVIIGGAFGKIVASLVSDIVMPLVGVLLGGVNFTGLAVKVGSASILYGKFLQTCVDFLIIAWAIFIAVKLINRLKREAPAAEPAPAAPPRQEVLLEEIRDLLKSRG